VQSHVIVSTIVSKTESQPRVLHHTRTYAPTDQATFYPQDTGHTLQLPLQNAQFLRLGVC